MAAVAEEGSFVGDVDGAAVVALDEAVCVAAGEVVDGNCHREHVQEDTGIALVAEVSLNFAIHMLIFEPSQAPPPQCSLISTYC